MKRKRNGYTYTLIEVIVFIVFLAVLLLLLSACGGGIYLLFKYVF